MTLTIAAIKRMLNELIDEHAETIPESSKLLLTSFINTENSSIEPLEGGRVRFAKKAIEKAHPETTPSTLRKRVQYLNSYFHSKGSDITVNLDKGFLLTFNEKTLAKKADQALVSLAKQISTFPDDDTLVAPEFFAEPCVFLSHKWHNNELDQQFQEMAALLENHLARPIKNRPRINCIYDGSPESGFKPQNVRQKQQDQACEKSQLGLIFWHREYDHSNDCQRELNYFINNSGENQTDKSAIVILELGELDHMPDAFLRRNIFFYPANSQHALLTFWKDADDVEKEGYIASLADCIYTALQPTTPPSKPTPPKSKLDRIDRAHTEAGATNKIDQALYEATLFASQSTNEDKPTEDPIFLNKDKREKLIPALTHWTNTFEADSTRVSVLLGDFGFGKTTACQLLANELSQQFQDKEPDALLPIYLDLKSLQANINQHKEKPIEYLLEALLNKTGRVLNISGKEIIDYIRTKPSLVIFDGFDELGHHLTETEQQSVYSALLDIIPEETYRRDAERLKKAEENNKQSQQKDQSENSIDNDGRYFPSKILISCRTHFFNKLNREDSFISGSARHPVGDRGAGTINIQKFTVAPFSADTVKSYLCRLLGKNEGEKALVMLNDIHDLSGLSKHPLMLSLITDQLPRLQELATADRPVNSATLYLNLFESVGNRDIGKHIIRLSDKQELLAALALELWRSRKTHISIKKLDNWFVKYSEQHPVIRNQLLSSTDAFYKLMQDLCNASLLVRNNDDQYRFAHTSYLEFFRALGIFEFIRQNTQPTFNRLLAGENLTIDKETLQFLINWRKATETEEREEFDAKFIQLLEANNDLYTKQMGYHIWAHGQLDTLEDSKTIAFPHSNKANWSQLKFTNYFIPKELTKLDYSQINLSGCYFHQVQFNRVNFSNANFSKSRLSQVYFHHCLLSTSQWQDTAVDPNSFFPRLPVNVKEPINNITRFNHLKLNKGHFSSVTSAAFNHDSSRIVSASDDQTLKLWDTHTGECLLTCKGHDISVTSAAFSHDSSRIVSASYDNTLKLWDTHTGECLLTCKGHDSSVTSAAFNHDSSRIVSASDDNTLKLWDTHTGHCLTTMMNLTNGELAYTESIEEFIPQKLSGSAWQYLLAKSDDGIAHPCQYEKWENIYTS